MLLIPELFFFGKSHGKNHTISCLSPGLAWDLDFSGPLGKLPLTICFLPSKNCVTFPSHVLYLLSDVKKKCLYISLLWLNMYSQTNNFYQKYLFQLSFTANNHIYQALILISVNCSISSWSENIEDLE